MNIFKRCKDNIIGAIAGFIDYRISDF